MKKIILSILILFSIFSNCYGGCSGDWECFGASKCVCIQRDANGKPIPNSGRCMATWLYGQPDC